MRKKVLSFLICLCMITTMLAACSKRADDTTTSENTTTATVDNSSSNTSTTTPATTTPDSGSVAAEALPTPVYYYSFDEAAGTAGFVSVAQDKAATPIVQDAPDKAPVFVEGVKGQAVYADGITGYKLSDVKGVGDNYTVSFWVNPSRSATYMPTLQYGPDIHGDLTGGQHYVNFTWAEWGGSQEFPCVWAYDQNGDEAVNWPNWFPGDGLTRVKEWSCITLVVDKNNTTEEGSNPVATLYLNGELFGTPTIVNGTMSPSDNFEMLLGVNYWDAVFKGAFDELYVFDQPLTAGQVKTLFADGNVNATYVEPEHVFEFYKEEKAIESIGNESFACEPFDYVSTAYPIADGETWQIKLHNWSASNDTNENYMLVLQADADGANNDNVYAILNADATATITGKGEVAASNFTYTWGNWKTFMQKVMKDSDTTLDITREGDTFYVTATNVDYNETPNVMTAILPAALPAADADAYFKLTCKNSYVDILSVKNKTVTDLGKIVGNMDRGTPFWSAFSDIWAIPVGESRSVSFTNYTDGSANWNNFLAVLQNTPNGHSAADVEGYTEFAVLRTDNWGWGAGYDGIAVAESDWNWDTFTSDMDGAKVTLTATNYGDHTDVVANVVCSDGSLHTQKYLGIATEGVVYLTLTCEKAYLSLDTVVVGSTDCSTPFWSSFSDIWCVPQGASRTVSFVNHTDGSANWNNFLIALQNVPGGHSADAYEGYKEYAVLRADNWGWGAGYDGIAAAESNWDWDNFSADIDGATVNATVVNNGTTADVHCTIVTEDGRLFVQNYTGIAIDGPLYFTLLCEKAYLEIYCATVGNPACDSPFWNQFSDIWAVPENTTASLSFTNNTDGAANWDNFVVILQTTPTGHSAETEGYAEYAVVRADSWGWGAGYDGIAAASGNWDWDSFTDDINGAHITLFVTNNGATADIEFTATTAAGKVFTQSYTGIATNGPLFFCLGLEKAYLTID